MLGVGYSQCEGVPPAGVEVRPERELSDGSVRVFRGGSRCGGCSCRRTVLGQTCNKLFGLLLSRCVV